MSVRVMSAVWQHTAATDAAVLVVLLALADHANDEGVAYPSQASLAGKARVSDRHVRNALRELEEKGEIETRKAQRGRKRMNVYRVLLGNPLPVDYDNMPFTLADPFTTGTDCRSSDGDDRNHATATTGTPVPVDASYREPSVEPSGKTDALARVESDYDPLKGRRIEGQDLPWNALAEATDAVGQANGPRMKRALKAIRDDALADVIDHGISVEDLAAQWESYERQLAQEITNRVAALRADAPSLTWGPEGVARNWRKGGLLMRDRRKVVDIIEDALDRARRTA